MERCNIKSELKPILIFNVIMKWSFGDQKFMSWL